MVPNPTGLFSWMPGSAFNGEYEIAFSMTSGAETERADVQIKWPRFRSLLIPVVAHSSGFGGTAWRSDIAAVNTGQRTATIAATYESDGTTLSHIHQLAPGAAVEWRDVLVSLLGLGADDTSSGSLSIAADGPILMTSRTYADQGAAGTYGQYEPALATGDSLRPGSVGVLPQIKNTELFYTNIGLVNTGVQSCSVLIYLYDESGVQIGNALFETLEVGEWKQLNDVFGELTLATGYATVQVVTARTYADMDAAGTYGQYEPALRAADMLDTGTTGILPQIRSGSGFYTNIGVINPGPGDVSRWSGSAP